MQSKDVTDVIDTLWSWSTNCCYPTPATLFIDLIGYSKEEYGENMCGEKLPSMGWLEADYLADALKAWANNPNEVYDYVTELLNNEMED